MSFIHKTNNNGERIEPWDMSQFILFNAEFIFFKHLFKVTQFIITIRVDCVRRRSMYYEYKLLSIGQIIMKSLESHDNTYAVIKYTSAMARGHQGS